LSKEKRTDRIIIAIALLVLMLSSGLYYFDGWMWGKRRGRGETIGVLTKTTGDVRLKFEDDLRWQKSSLGQDLAYNDSIYAGEKSYAEIKVSDSNLKMNENTLIVLRHDMDINYLNINFGSLFAKLGAKDQFVVDLGDGKPIKLADAKNAQIMITRESGKAKLEVSSGSLSMTKDGVTTKIDKASRLVVGDNPQAMTPNKLQIIKPLTGEALVSTDPTRLDFAWRWQRERQALPNDAYTLEFSADPSFMTLHIKKNVRGDLKTSMSVAQSLQLYFRVRGPNNELSQTEKLDYLRLIKPVIVQPLAQALIESPDGKSSDVALEFQRPQEATIWYQVASEASFQQVLLNQNTPDLKRLQNLSVGDYFIRARSDFGSNRVSEWTEPRPFSVIQKALPLQLAARSVPSRVVIPNRNYPRLLYVAPSDTVKAFLGERGFMRAFVPLKPDEYDQIQLQVNETVAAQNTTDWPAKDLYPGTYRYRYQASKQGFKPSDWSTTKKVEITMEPVRPLGEASYGSANAKNERLAEWKFTPLLYARSYDVEVAPSTDFVHAHEVRSEDASVSTELPQTDRQLFWRARARDVHGRIISDFSKPYPLKQMPQAIPNYLAKNTRPLRKPAQTNTSTGRIQRVREKPWESSGWWAWAGIGENYVDNSQSLGVGVARYYQVYGPSQYFEAGYRSKGGIGAVLTYKSTPGKINITQNKSDSAYPLDNDRYRWTAISAEAMTRGLSKFTLLEGPIYYGLRAGLQDHRTPFLVVNEEEATIELKMNSMTTASFGGYAEWMRKKWTYHWLMRYQLPFSSSSPGASSFAITPIFAFDGSVGAAYNISQQIKLGFFWYGQWHQYKYNYARADLTTNSGSQSLFYSNIDVRLGVDF
jgi:hypothetical protein